MKRWWRNIIREASKDVHVGLRLGSWQHPCQPVGCPGLKIDAADNMEPTEKVKAAVCLDRYEYDMF